MIAIKKTLGTYCLIKSKALLTMGAFLVALYLLMIAKSNLLFFVLLMSLYLFAKWCFKVDGDWMLGFLRVHSARKGVGFRQQR